MFLTGLGIGMALASLLDWLIEVYPEFSWRAFWLPVRDKVWNKTHILAHLLGGVFISAVLLTSPYIVLPHFYQRLIGILTFQVIWERIQHENWKEGGSSKYPWPSFVWDVLITLLGFFLVEGVNLL